MTSNAQQVTSASGIVDIRGFTNSAVASQFF